MYPEILADLVALLHLSFIIFIVFGGFLCFRWPRLAWIHIPSFLWGGAISFGDWVCPLTYLENSLRAKGFGGGFIEYYLLPIIYPERLFGDFPRYGFIMIGIFVLVLNGFIYWRLWKQK